MLLSLLGFPTVNLGPTITQPKRFGGVIMTDRNPRFPTKYSHRLSVSRDRNAIADRNRNVFKRRTSNQHYRSPSPNWLTDNDGDTIGIRSDATLEQHGTCSDLAPGVGAGAPTTGPQDRRSDHMSSPSAPTVLRAIMPPPRYLPERKSVFAGDRGGLASMRGFARRNSRSRGRKLGRNVDAGDMRSDLSQCLNVVGGGGVAAQLFCESANVASTDVAAAPAKRDQDQGTSSEAINDTMDLIVAALAHLQDAMHAMEVTVQRTDDTVSVLARRILRLEEKVEILERRPEPKLEEEVSEKVLAKSESDGATSETERLTPITEHEVDSDDAGGGGGGGDGGGDASGKAGPGTKAMEEEIASVQETISQGELCSEQEPFSFASHKDSQTTSSAPQPPQRPNSPQRSPSPSPSPAPSPSPTHSPSSSKGMSTTSSRIGSPLASIVFAASTSRVCLPNSNVADSPTATAPCCSRLHLDQEPHAKARPRDAMGTPNFSESDAAMFYRPRMTPSTTALQPWSSRMSQGAPPPLVLPPKCWEDLGRELLDAVQDGKCEEVKLLLDSGADPNVAFDSKWTPLHRAARRGDASIIALLLQRGAAVNQRTSYGFSPLHVAAYNDFHGHCANMLIKAGAQLECRNQTGRTPLHAAAECGNVEVVVLLLKAGADTRAKDEDGNKPLDLAKVSSVRRLLATVT